MMLKYLTITVLSLIIVISIIKNCECAIATHSHRHTISPGHPEREEDGAYSPRSSSHYNELNEQDSHNVAFDHEAILGSVKDAEDYDNLPPEEAKKRLGILVEKMDLDKNGNIERHELKAWIIRSFGMLSSEESQERFEEADENNDGKVSWVEYVAETFGVDAEDPAFSKDSLEDVKMLADDKLLFTGADKNQDGYLERSEYLAFSHPEEDPEMFPIVLQQTLDEKDTNKDGEIDFKEFIGDRGKDKDQEWLLEEKSRFDNELDKNNDGLLNREEILSWVLPSNEEIADEEVSHLFAASDDDHDNKLSYDEILDHHDVFVGSEATDYGDHLHFMERFNDEL